MKKMSDLLEKDLKIVQKRKYIFLVPLCVVVLAIVMGVVYHFTMGSALNLGMDFQGGYTINVNVGASLTEANTDKYKDIVTDIVENYSDAENKPYGIKISQIFVLGEGDDTALQIRFKSIGDDATMEAIVDGIIEKINEKVTVIVPSIKQEGNTVTLTYNDFIINSYGKILGDKAATVEGLTLHEIGKDFTNEVQLDYSFDGLTEEQINAKLDNIVSAMSINNRYSATTYANGKVGATVSQDLLFNAISAILIALVLMLVYIAIRFEFKSGISAIVALVHDLLIMFAFMIIFHIEFNSTFIAALITILGYSINNTIILFDRVRSNLKINKNVDKFELANKSISQSLVRCMNTTITTVIMIGCVAVVCAIVSIFNPDLYQMVTFSLPIIVGLLSGFFSAMFIAPSVWVSFDHQQLKDTTEKKGATPVEAKE